MITVAAETARVCPCLSKCVYTCGLKNTMLGLVLPAERVKNVCGECLTNWGFRRASPRTIFFRLYGNSFSERLKGFHCVICKEISGRSLLALAVSVHPLDLRPGLALGYEHSQHAWLARFVAAHSQRHSRTEMHFHFAEWRCNFQTSLCEA